MRGNAARAFLPAVAVLALAAVVAIAAGGSTPGGSSDRRGPSELVLDTLLTLTLLLFAFAIAFLVYAFIHRREIGNLRPPQRHRTSAVWSLFFFVAILAIVALLHSRGLFRGSEEGEGQPAGTIPPGGGEEPEPTRYEPELAWLPLLVVGALAAIAYVAFTVAARRRRGPRPRSGVAATLADVLDDSLDDLRAEADPRRAVIAAYARLERVLAAHGLARRSPETPEEYLSRILPDLEVGVRSIRRLTDLFLWAKFSHHDVRPAMKEEAIAALTTARDDLRAAAAPADEEAAQGLVAVERPA
jgi:membrane protease YdiL (CAAX protease family)